MNTEFYPAKISNVERLTKESIAVEFELSDDQKQFFSFKQGQHLTVRANIAGQEVRRSYSICNGVHSNKLQIGIKAITDGLFSNFANKELEKGMTLELMPPQGHFYCELSPDNQKHYFLIAAGSGITPMLSHIESILDIEPKSQVTLLYGNKKVPLMMFKDRLSFAKNKYMERFQWINCLTDQESDSEILNGRISPKKVLELHDNKLIDISVFNEIFICGPEEMTMSLAEAFKFWSFGSDQIHYELFFSGSAEQQAQKTQTQRAEKFGDQTASVSIKVAGRKTKFQLEKGGENILDAAMAEGADLPYSCKGGVCATCKAKVTKGEVEMDLNHSLTEQEVADGMILTCQSHPISDQVEVDFDFS